ncbi:MAG TPA: hypothetical protein VM553_04560, partial [Dongiaceae bacterium]|nr:hypothetical protein [Dongiaceae bacterium]
DLRWLREQGWETIVQRHLRFGGKLLGICGGFQMLGQQLLDPLGIEGAQKSIEGFGWLEMTTELRPQKQLHRRSGRLLLKVESGADQSVDTNSQGARCEGYEIHAGVSTGPALEIPLLQFDDVAASADGQNNAVCDGAWSPCGQIAGTYLHGVFDHPEALSALLAWSGLVQAEKLDYRALREHHIDRLADATEQHLDMDAIRRILAG